MLPKINPTRTGSWKDLESHFENIQDNTILSFFEEGNRVKDFTLTFKDLYLDFSKNRIDRKGMELLRELTKECQLEEAREAFFSGKHINETEERSVMHPALRRPRGAEEKGDGGEVKAKAGEAWGGDAECVSKVR